jgi:hypothetical protein
MTQVLFDIPSWNKFIPQPSTSVYETLRYNWSLKFQRKLNCLVLLSFWAKKQKFSQKIYDKSEKSQLLGTLSSFNSSKGTI